MRPLQYLLLIASCIFLSNYGFATTYTFTGNGVWTNASNWAGGNIPPKNLPSGDSVMISGAAIVGTTNDFSLRTGVQLQFQLEAP